MPGWLSFIADAGGEHGWDLAIEQAPGRHLEIVPASNCPEVRNRHDNTIGTPAVNWLGNLTTTWQEIEQEPNLSNSASDQSREIAVTRLR